MSGFEPPAQHPPPYIITVYGCEGDKLLAEAIMKLLSPILARAKLHPGEFKFKVSAQRPSSADPSISFRHDSKDIVYYHHVTIVNQPGVDGYLKGVLRIPDSAVRGQLVDELNQAVTSKACQPVNNHDAEEDDVGKKRGVITNGRDVLVRKSRSVHVSVPHQINRVIDSLLDEANMPPGRYEFLIDKVSSSPATGKVFVLDIGPTLRRGVYRLSILTRETGLTFAGAT